jgi:hypothetical protein
MMDQAQAEVAAGLYSEHPKLEIMHDIIGSILMNNKAHLDLISKVLSPSYISIYFLS